MIPIFEKYDIEDEMLINFIDEMQEIFLQYFPNGSFDVSIFQNPQEYTLMKVVPSVDCRSSATGDRELVVTALYAGHDVGSEKVVLQDSNIWEVATNNPETSRYNGKIRIEKTPEEVLDIWDSYCLNLERLLRKLRRKDLLSDAHAEIVKDL